MGKYSSLRDFFLYLNDNCTYLILRNWDDVFNEGIYGDSHEDIDILCDDLETFIKLTNALNIHEGKDRDNYVVQIGNMKVRFDIRHIGDEYYPAEWEKKMLQRREKKGDIYIMGKEDYAFSLIYHALLQKPSLSDEYKNKIFALIKDKYYSSHKTEIPLLDILSAFLRGNGYTFKIPSDPGVFINWKNIRYVGYAINLKNLRRRILFKLGVRIKRIVGFLRILRNE